MRPAELPRHPQSSVPGPEAPRWQRARPGRVPFVSQQARWRVLRLSFFKQAPLKPGFLRSTGHVARRMAGAKV
eukprot:5265159-Alexandrium_andersonii.AAC.1